jgi:Flp pilus assembly protein TadG
MRRQRKQRGAAIIEFALGFMFFLVLIVGLMELSRGVWVYNTMTHATRQAARWAMAHGSVNPATKDQIRKIVLANSVGLDPTRLTVNTTWTPSNTRGAEVQVRSQYTFPFVSGSLITKQSTINITSTSRMIVAN